MSESSMNEASIASKRLHRFIAGSEGAGRVVFLCAEPGMGKTALAFRILRDAPEGTWTTHRSLVRCTSAAATQQLVQLADVVERRIREGASPSDEPADVAGRRMREEASPPEESPAGERRVMEGALFRAVVVIEQTPVPDECDLDAQAMALHRMGEAGCLVVVCMRPEAVQLARELPQALCLGVEDLLGRPAGVAFEGGSDAARAFTNGVPQLVDAYDTAFGEGLECPLDLPEYRLALQSVLKGCLREVLPEEERRLRLAMLLLGSGDFDDIAAVARRLDEDVLSWLAAEVRLLGIDLMGGTFRCAGIGDTAGLEQCLDTLRPYGEQMPEVVSRVTRILAHRGELRRMALTCGLCAQDDLADLGCEWGVELVCVGSVALARRALALRANLGLPTSDPTEMTQVALSVLSDSRAGARRFKPVPAMRNGMPDERRRCRHVELLQACRDLDRGVTPGRVSFARSDDDEISLDFVDHLRARQLLIEGCFTEAYELLIDRTSRLAPNTLPAALLSDDFQLVTALLGIVPSEADQMAFQRSHAFFSRMQVDRLRGYRDALGRILGVLAARSDACGFQEAMALAERMGDRTVQEVLCLAEAVAEMRAGLLESAHVHAFRVRELADGALLTYLADVATLVDDIVLVRFGEAGALHRLALSGHPSVVRDLARLATFDAAGEQSHVSLSVLSRIGRPRNELWLLNIMYNDYDPEDTSHAFRENAPKAWAELSRKAVRAMERRLRVREHEMPARDVRRVTVPRRSRKETRQRTPLVEVRALGGFEVLLGGQEVTDQLARRGARQLVALLVAARGHKLRRYEVMESLHPGTDYPAATQKVYEGTSVARRALRYREVGIDPIVTNRSDGTLQLNPTLITCDVDAFERCARRATMAPARDEEMMRLVGEAITLYRGDLYVARYDARGIMAERRDELRRLYVDVSMAGAHAALEMGNAPQAVDLARRAYLYEAMREDVVYVLVSALRASGRNRDACEVYETYARCLLDKESRPPEAGLRRLVEDVYEAGGRGGGVRRMSEELASVAL